MNVSLEFVIAEIKKSARNAALEEAAKVCETDWVDGKTATAADWTRTVGQALAEKIRSLKTAAAPEQ